MVGVMSYRCGVGPMLGSMLGVEHGERAPAFTCDGCGAVRVVSTRSLPPSWFLAGKAPPGWKLVCIGDDRRDYCPDCKGPVEP